MLGLYTKLKKHHDRSFTKEGPKVKEEEYAFTGESESPIPSWAQDLKSQVMMIRTYLSNEEQPEEKLEDDGTDKECYQTRSFKKNDTTSKWQKPKDKRCYECEKVGHLAAECFWRRCSNCQGSGHNQNQCPSSIRLGNQKQL